MVRAIVPNVARVSGGKPDGNRETVNFIDDLRSVARLLDKAKESEPLRKD
jgi:hypothetical protein